MPETTTIPNTAPVIAPWEPDPDILTPRRLCPAQRDKVTRVIEDE